MQVEILPPNREPHLHIAQVRAPGWFGTGLALLTMLAAFGVGFLALFGKTLLAAIILTLAWPWLFSPRLTAWVFGTEHVVFWKVLLLFLTCNAVVRLFRRELWPKK